MADVEALKEAGIVSIRDELIRRQRNGSDVARTESGDPSFDIPDRVAAAMAKALFTGKTHYTAGSGIPELLEAVSAKFRRESGCFVDPKDVIITNGAMHGLYVVFRALIQRPGDVVLVPTPTWTETAVNVEMAGGTPVYYKLDPFAREPIDLEEIGKLLEQSAPGKVVRAVVINTPHNPTGRVLPHSTLSGLRAMCLAAKIPLISDEAYEHLIYGEAEHISPLTMGNPTIYDIGIFSCSKSYAMSGLRVGYVVTKDGRLMSRLRKLVRCSINGVNSVAQHGAAVAIGNTDMGHRALMLSEYEARREILFEALESSSLFTPVRPEGAFYIWAKLPDGVGGWDATARLLDLGVGSAPGDVFGPGGKGHIRFAFSCPTRHVEMAADRIGRLSSL